MVRFDSYDKGPEATLRRRREELETLDLRLRQERLNKKRRLTRKAEAELQLLRWLYPPQPPPGTGLTGMTLAAERCISEETLARSPEDIEDWRARDHPFATEEPDLDGNFYGFVGPDYIPPLVFGRLDFPPYLDLPEEKWPKTEEEFNKLTEGMIQQGWGCWIKAEDAGKEQGTPSPPRGEDQP